jgi:hypothetical protein
MIKLMMWNAGFWYSVESYEADEAYTAVFQQRIQEYQMGRVCKLVWA